jgi:hypothetical protein
VGAVELLAGNRLPLMGGADTDRFAPPIDSPAGTTGLEGSFFLPNAGVASFRKAPR